MVQIHREDPAAAAGRNLFAEKSNDLMFIERRYAGAQQRDGGQSLIPSDR
jgi:hypothetical protein